MAERSDRHDLAIGLLEKARKYRPNDPRLLWALGSHPAHGVRSEQSWPQPIASWQWRPSRTSGAFTQPSIGTWRTPWRAGRRTTRQRPSISGHTWSDISPCMGRCRRTSTTFYDKMVLFGDNEWVPPVSEKADPPQALQVASEPATTLRFGIHRPSWRSMTPPCRRRHSTSRPPPREERSCKTSRLVRRKCTRPVSEPVCLLEGVPTLLAAPNGLADDSRRSRPLSRLRPQYGRGATGNREVLAMAHGPQGREFPLRDMADDAYRDRPRSHEGEAHATHWSVPMRRCAVRDVLFYLSASGARDKAVTAYQQSVGECGQRLGPSARSHWVPTARNRTGRS